MIKIIDLSTMRERGLDGCASVLCLGNFDGVHVAHIELIKMCTVLAERLSKNTVAKILRGAFFFSDHPSERLGGDSDALLTTLEDKLEIFQSWGLDIAVVADFSEMMDMSPEDFVRDVLIKKCGAAGVVCGYNFRFGKGGTADARRLSSLFGEAGCEIVGEITLEGREISSSAIRRALKYGNVKEAATLLGRNFSVRAKLERDSNDTVLARFAQNIATPKEGKYKVRLFQDGKTVEADALVFYKKDSAFCSVLDKALSIGAQVKIEFLDRI